MTGVLLTVGVVLVIANGVFVAAEFAVVAARRSRLQQLAQGGRRARVALAASRDVPATLAATQLGITMASIGLGFTAEAAVESTFVPLVERLLPLPDPIVQALGAALALGVVVGAHVVLGEMVPKNLAVTAPGAHRTLAAADRTSIHPGGAPCGSLADRHGRRPAASRGHRAAE
jgi:CBS domain containing-hemolysin-like protein